MFCTAENSQFIDKILQMKPEEVKQLLNFEDQKYIIRKKQQIIRKMPQILKPQQIGLFQKENFVKTFYDKNFSVQKTKGNETKNIHFPSNFQQNGRTHLLKSKSQETKYFTGDFQNLIPKANNFPFTFESGIKGQFLSWKGQTLSEKILNDSILDEERKQEKIEAKEQKIKREIPFDTQKDISFKKQQQQIEIGDKQPKIAEKNQLNESVRSSGSSKKQKVVENPFVSPVFQQPKNSPFISNKTNFLDLHTNKKVTVGNYLSPEVYSMNMLQYAHNKKRQNTFDDRYSYPNIIMGGSGTGWMKTAQEMRDNPFQTTFVAGSKTFNIPNQDNYQKDLTEAKNSIKVQADNRFRQNVKDTLKYTLGDRRYTSTIPDRSKEGNRIQNSKTIGFEGSMKKQVPQGKTKLLENPFVRRPSSTYKN